jgi:hypothetical protein
MDKLNLKPSHKSVQDYFRALDQFRSLKVTHETAVRAAVQKLLETYARQFKWTVVAVVSNNSFIEILAFDGMRKHYQSLCSQAGSRVELARGKVLIWGE